MPHDSLFTKVEIVVGATHLKADELEAVRKLVVRMPNDPILDAAATALRDKITEVVPNLHALAAALSSAAHALPPPYPEP